MKNKILAITFFSMLVVLIIILRIQENENNIDSNISATNLSREESEDSSEKNKLFKVDIKGAVKKPGVYEINSDKRVIDVIKLSGGLKNNANTNYINLSAKVKDEMVIWIYTTREIEKLKLKQSSSEYMIKSCNCPVVDNTACLSNSNKEESKNTNSIININDASVEQLMTLSGVGESKAKSIIEYRNKNGKFIKPEDIMNVTGIGESLYNKIKDNITV